MMWLGQADADATAAIQFARTLDASRYHKEYKPTVMHSGNETQCLQKKSHILDLLKDHPEKELLINSCAEFLLRPYFTRVWCQQEGSLSAEPVVIYRSLHLPWDQLFALAWLFLPTYTMTWPEWFPTNY